MLRQILPLAVPQAAGALAALGGLGLLMLARGIRHGQRRAYLVCLVTLVAVATLHLVRAGGVAPAIVALAVAAFLWLRRASFRASSDVPPVRGALLRLLGLAVAAVGAGTLALEGTSWVTTTVHHREAARIGWVQALQATTERMVGIYHVALPDRLDDFFSPAMFSVSAGLVLVAAGMAFRPVVARWPRHATTGGLERAHEVVRRYGGGTLDYFTLRTDKQFFFWGGTVVAYAVYSGVCLVSPDPVGPPAEREGAWRGFREFADSRGWSLALIGASEDWLPIYRSTGMHDLYVGDEAVVRTEHFSLKGGKFKGLRQAVKRVARNGYTISFHDPAHIDPALAEELAEVMTKSRRGGVERGFSMTLGRIFDPQDEGLLMAVVHGPLPEGEPAGPRPWPGRGLLPVRAGPGHRGVFSRPHAPGQRRAPQRAHRLRHCRDHPAPGRRGLQGPRPELRHHAGRFGGGGRGRLAERVQAWLVRRMSGSMQIESLWRFNAKFDPEWQPRYAVYDSPEHALPTALAVARAESIWELPIIGRFMVPSAQRQVEAAGASTGQNE